MRRYLTYVCDHADWFLVILMSCAVSWPLFHGTVFVLGLDYFNHLSQGYAIQQGIGEGHFIPAYHFYYGGGGSTLIRYQGMLVNQVIGWCCFFLRHLFGLADTDAIVAAGRIVSIAINLLAGLAFYYSMRKLVDIPFAAFVATCAYLWGWSRLGVLLHVGAVQRAGAHIFFPLCFVLYLLWWQRPLSRREQIVLGLAAAGCLLSHLANFVFLVLLCSIQGVVEFGSRLARWLRVGTLPWSQARSRVLNMAPSFLLSAGLTVWFWLPLFCERGYYGQSLSLQESLQPVSLNKVLPLAYSHEFVDREAWFGNSSTDPLKGGSYLANVTGVNSAYFGISVLFITLFALLLQRFRTEEGNLARRLSLTALCFLVLIFAEGVRHWAFGSIAHQLYLACRWLEPFYFLVCVMSAFGAWFVWEIGQRMQRGKKLSQCLMLVLAALVVGDFASLIFFSKVSFRYLPLKGQTNALAFRKNQGVFDSFDVLHRAGQDGRVLDLPLYNDNCNRIYHGRQATFSFYESNWPALLSYTDLVVRKEAKAMLDIPDYITSQHSRGLAYRLALLDVRYLVFNLRYASVQLEDCPSSIWLRKLYQSRTSVVYENLLSTPFMFPQKMYLIPGPQPWHSFNDKIAHHPLYQPHLAGFCYTGEAEKFSGVLQLSEQWQKQIAELFMGEENPPFGQAKVVAMSVESMSIQVTMQQAGFLFASYAFHPNLRAMREINGHREPLPIYLAQAGMMAIPLQAGDSRLTIFYHHPWYDWFGKLLSAMTVICLSGGLGLKLLRRAR
jgi:hypothetical protein